jgi:hypothetical protein
MSFRRAMLLQCISKSNHHRLFYRDCVICFRNIPTEINKCQFVYFKLKSIQTGHWYALVIIINFVSNKLGIFVLWVGFCLDTMLLESGIIKVKNSIAHKSGYYTFVIEKNVCFLIGNIEGWWKSIFRGLLGQEYHINKSLRIIFLGISKKNFSSNLVVFLVEILGQFIS